MKKFYSTLLNICILCVLMTSNNIYSQFDPKPSGTDHLLYDLSIPQGQNLIAYAAGSLYTIGGYGSVILKSEDGGETWSTVYSTEDGGFLQIEFVNNTRGFAVGFDATAFETSDGGVTWTEMVLSGPTDVAEYTVIDFVDANNGFLAGIRSAMGGPLVAYTTSDGGDTWIEINSTNNMFYFCGDIAAPNIIYTAGKDHGWGKSIDNGNSWTLIDWDGGPTGNYYFAMKFKDADSGVITTEDGDIRMTYDGGDTFSTVYQTYYHNFYALHYQDNHVFVGGTDEDIFYSSDNGATWSEFYNGSSSSTLYTIELFDNGDALVCGALGIILKSEGLLSIEDNVLSNSDLVHFYNPSTKILTFEINTGDFITNYNMYDINGKRIYESVTNNANQVEINLETLTDGVYIVNYKVDGNSYSFKFVRH